jgi:hypothetical protein
LPARNIKAVLGLLAGFGLYPLQAEACSGIGIDPRLAAICNLHAANTTPQTLQSLVRSHQALTRIGFRDGIQLFPSGQALDLKITASPTLSFSENINGGLPNGTLEVAELSFSPSQDQMRESGWLLGFELGAYGNYSLGRGSYLDFQAAASTQRAADHDLNVNRLAVGICGHFHAGNWRYVDICGNRRIEEKDLSTERLTQASVDLSQLWSADALSYRLSGGVLLSSSQSGERDTGLSIEGEFVGLDGRSGGIQLELKNGSIPTEGHDYRARVWLGGNLSDRPFQAFAELGSTYEGEILSVERVDRTTQLGVAYVPRSNWIVSLGLTRVESSIDYFSTTSPFFSLRYQALAF